MKSDEKLHAAFLAAHRFFRAATIAALPAALSMVAFDLVRLASLAVRSHNSLAAKNLFLRKQLALFQERKVKPVGRTMPTAG
jgi:hypothetical protein